MKLWKEFKDFIAHGNVLDLAVGLVMGSAFTAIVNSLVADIIMPIVSGLTAGVNVEDLSVTIYGATLKYGSFIQAIITFLIIAFVLFLIIKGANNLKARTKKEEDVVEVVKDPTVEDYLADIRQMMIEEKNKRDTLK